MKKKTPQELCQLAIDRLIATPRANSEACDKGIGETMDTLCQLQKALEPPDEIWTLLKDAHAFIGEELLVSGIVDDYSDDGTMRKEAQDLANRLFVILGTMPTHESPACPEDPDGQHFTGCNCEDK